MGEAGSEPLPVVPIVHEGDVHSSHALRERFAAPKPDDPVDDTDTIVQHETFGDDIVTQAVASVEDWIDRARETFAPPPVEGTRSTNPLLPKRFAQVIQATHTPMADVLAALDDRTGVWRDRLRIDGRLPSPKSTGRRETMYGARLRMPILGRRRVTLRVYPTPSTNLTVIEMLPKRRWMPQTRRYLHAGVPAVTTLMRSFSREAAEPRPSRVGGGSA